MVQSVHAVNPGSGTTGHDDILRDCPSSDGEAKLEGVGHLRVDEESRQHLPHETFLAQRAPVSVFQAEVSGLVAGKGT